MVERRTGFTAAQNFIPLYESWAQCTGVDPKWSFLRDEYNQFKNNTPIGSAKVLKDCADAYKELQGVLKDKSSPLVGEERAKQYVNIMNLQALSLYALNESKAQTCKLSDEQTSTAVENPNIDFVSNLIEEAIKKRPELDTHDLLHLNGTVLKQYKFSEKLSTPCTKEETEKYKAMVSAFQNHMDKTKESLEQYRKHQA